MRTLTRSSASATATCRPSSNITQPGHLTPGAALSGLIDAQGVVTIGDNQVLFLFELGSTTSQNNPSFNYQDLVVLATLNTPGNPAECQDTPIPPPTPPPPPTPGLSVEAAARRDHNQTCSDVAIKVLGSQFGYSNGTRWCMSAREVQIGGSASVALDGGQPVKGGDTYSITNVPAGTQIAMGADSGTPP